MKRYTEPGDGVLAVGWPEGETVEALKRLQQYENTNLTPEAVERLQRDADKHRGAGLKYEEEMERYREKYELLAETVAELGRDNRILRKGSRKARLTEWLLWALASVMTGLALYWTVEIWRRWDDG